MKPSAGVTVLSLVLSLAACRDGGQMHYDDALRMHSRAVEKGESPGSPAFDAVLAELDKVPPDSKRAVDAQRLRAAIIAVRNPIRRPLAMAYSAKDEATLPPAVAAQARACARLAELVGRDGGANPSGLKALDDCRKKVDELREAAEHADEPPL